MDTEIGLYKKYNVTRTDGKPIVGMIFVLECGKDPAAIIALAAYAETIRHTHKRLYADLRHIIDLSGAKP